LLPFSQMGVETATGLHCGRRGGGIS